MSVFVASFRADFPEFADSATYPDQQIVFWLNFAWTALNARRWGGSSPYTILPVVASGGAGYAVADQVTLLGGTSYAPAVLAVSAVGAGGVVTGATTFDIGNYIAVPPNPVAQLRTTGAGLGATFNLTFYQQPNSIYDTAVELYTAHNLALEQQAGNAASVGGTPGLASGVLTSKSVGGVSAGYDANIASVDGGGAWNLTTYGVRLLQLSRLIGAGPLQT